MRADRAIISGYCAALLLSASRDARAFCRFVTSPSPGFPADGCSTEGRPLYWKSSCVGYRMNEAASKHLSLADASSIMASASAGWVSGGGVCFPSISVTALAPTASTRIGYEIDKPNENIVVFMEDWPEDWSMDARPGTDPLSSETPMITYNLKTGEILDVDVAIRPYLDGVIDDVVDAGFDVFNLQWVMTHAAGHFLGLSHSDTTDEAVMRLSWPPPSRPWIKDDDYQGICAIYPQNGVRTTTDEAGNPVTVNATPCNLFAQDNCGGEPDVGHGCSLSPTAKSPSFGLGALLVTYFAGALRRRSRRFSWSGVSAPSTSCSFLTRTWMLGCARSPSHRGSARPAVCAAGRARPIRPSCSADPPRRSGTASSSAT